MNPACVAACPTGAHAKDPDTGIVSINEEECIGCRACVEACPYGAPQYVEVKGVTLEEDGVCRFPDAPTQRGARHLRELILAKQQGYDAAVLFVIQMAPVRYVTPNDATDPEFGKALREAAANGVSVLAVDCHVTPDTMTIGNPVAVQL